MLQHCVLLKNFAYDTSFFLPFSERSLLGLALEVDCNSNHRPSVL